MATTAEVVVDYLARAGIGRIYGVPGEGSCLDLIEAARARHIECLATQNGGAAAIMAATDGDLTGKPGICITALGFGATSAIAGVAHAYLDRVPLIVLAGRAARDSLRAGTRQSIDQRLIFRAVTKDGATVTRSRAARLVSWAWEEATTSPAGPVHLDFPADESVRPARRRVISAPSAKPADPSPSAIRHLAGLLTRSGRAVIVAGSGCRDPAVARPLRELVEHLGAPTLTTARAKGVIPEDHPLAAGVFSGGPLEEELLGRADCVLAAGVDPAEILPRPWKAGRPVLSMADYAMTPCPFVATAEATGSLSAGLVLLRQGLLPTGEWGLANWARRGEAFRTRTRTLLAEATPPRGQHGLAPHRVVEIAREVFPRPTVATVDTGAHALAVPAFWEAYEPKTYLCSGGLAGTGYAIPAAIAAKLTAPERPVLAFTGESGLLLSLPEVATASGLGLKIVVVVFVDDSLSLIRVAQEQKRYAPVGVSLPRLDIPKIADGLGALGTAVEDEEELRAALSDALEAPKPAIIAVRVNPHGYRRMLEVLRGKA
jgi:acetolactate synthase-1/2/3 large subunit